MGIICSAYFDFSCTIRKSNGLAIHCFETQTPRLRLTDLECSCDLPNGHTTVKQIGCLLKKRGGEIAARPSQPLLPIGVERFK